jgi:hypothetical protein
MFLPLNWASHTQIWPKVPPLARRSARGAMERAPACPCASGLLGAGGGHAGGEGVGWGYQVIHSHASVETFFYRFRLVFG